MQQNTTDTKGIIAVIIATALWGSSFIAMKYAVATFHPMSLMFVRMCMAAVVGSAFMLILKVKVSYHKGDWKYLLIMTACEPCLYFLFEANALRYTTASQAGMLVAAMPIMVGVFAYIFLKEKLSKTAWIGCIIAITGVIWLSFGALKTENAPNPLLGNFLELLATISASVYAVCVRKLSHGYSPVFITTLQAWAGVVFFLPLMRIAGEGLPVNATPYAWGSVIYLGAIVTFGAFGLYNYSLSRIEAAKVSVFLNLIPVFTLIMGIFILNDTFTPMQFAASALVFAGVILSQKK